MLRRRAMTNASKTTKRELKYKEMGVSNASLVEILDNADKETNLVDFSGNAIGPNGAVAISNFLKSHTGIRTLNLSDNKFILNVWEGPSTVAYTSLDVPSLAEQIKQVRKDGIIELCSGIGALKLLESLSLSKTGIDDKNIVPLSISLNNITTLKVLDFSDNKINFKSMEHLSKSLLRNAANLQVLDLRHNELDDKEDPAGAKTFIESLSRLGNLVELRLGGNFLSLDFLMQLFERLTYLKTVTSLDLSNNKSGDDIVQVFDTMSFKLFHLKALDLSGNILDDIALNNLVFSFMDIRLTTLNLSDNLGGGRAIASVIFFQAGLKSLDISSNKIDDNEVEYFAEQLERLKQLDELDMSGNPFSSEGASIILDSLEASGAPLKRLNLGNGIGEVNQSRVRTILARSLKADLTHPAAAASAASHPS